jgi:hypothetical protein
MIGQFLVGGMIYALALIIIAHLVSRFIGEIYGRALLAIMLVVAGGAYVGFAVAGDAGWLWLLVELVQAVILGAFALLGLRGSPYWLAAGWSIHPIWDVVLHYVGAGHAFAPEAWTIPCASFDLVVAAYVAIAHRFGLTQRNGDDHDRVYTAPTPADHRHRPAISGVAIPAARWKSPSRATARSLTRPVQRGR